MEPVAIWQNDLYTHYKITYRRENVYAARAGRKKNLLGGRKRRGKYL